MPIKRIDNLGSGIVTDIDPFLLPDNSWSAGNNVFFKNGAVSKIKGHSEFHTVPSDWDSTANEISYFTLPVANGSNYYWIYAGLKQVRLFDPSNSTSVEITNSTAGSYAATPTINWTGGIITGFPVLNNGVDEPQYWTDPTDATTPALLAPLTGWDSNWTCKALRVYKNYLIAMDITKSGTRYPQMVKWSDSAGVGAIPTSWDETDATKDAGENDLAEARKNATFGAVVDCLVLRDTNIVYTDNSVWTMSFIGGNSIFQFREIFPNIGILSRRCAAEFNGRHFVIGQGDVYIHDGTSYQSVIDEKRKEELFNAIDGNYYDRTYVFPNYAKKEMWICYVETGHLSALPNKVMTWSWEDGSWSSRDLPNSNATVGANGGFGTPHISSGIVDTSALGDLWSTDDGTWASWNVTWGATGLQPQKDSPVLAADELYKGDETEQFDGTSFTSYVERKDLPLGNPDEGTQDDIVRIKRIYPRMTGTADLNIYIAGQMNPGETPDYTQYTFTPSDRKIDVRKSGTHMAIKIESTGNQSWKASGFDIEYELSGKR